MFGIRSLRLRIVWFSIFFRFCRVSWIVCVLIILSFLRRLSFCRVILVGVVVVMIWSCGICFSMRSVWIFFFFLVSGSGRGSI